MATSLKQKTVSAIFWKGLETFGTQFIQLVVTIILARLLLPEQFGLIAMLAIFISLSQEFIIAGFSQALIQKKDTTFIDECSIFYFNIFTAAVIYFILFFSAPLIANFFSQPLLKPILRVISINLIIGSFAQIQQTLLTKKIDFKSQLKIGITSIILSGLVGITMAYMDFGVWALVFQQITFTLIRSISFWLVSSWRPRLVFSFISLKTLFNYGSKILLSFLNETNLSKALRT